MIRLYGTPDQEVSTYFFLHQGAGLLNSKTRKLSSMKILFSLRFFLFPALLIISSCTYTFYPATCDYPVAGQLKKIAVLPDELNETSGLARRNNTLFTFNDSGGDPAIFSFSGKGTILQKTVVANALNTDWEAITADSNFFYIADVGNNFGNRDTLTIYKVPVAGFSEGNHPTTPEVIRFSYDETTSKSAGGWYSHDCEALFAFGDSLYLYAKDWTTKNTRVYVLPKLSGYYQIKSRITYPVKALITGADIDPVRREVVLTGYRNYTPVLIRYSFIDDPASIHCGGKARIYPRQAGAQVEGICYGENGVIYVTSEKTFRSQALYRSY